MDFKLDESLGYLLSRTNTKLKNELLQRFKAYDVTPEQWALLNGLWEKDGISPKELSERTSKDQPTTVRILAKLEKKEFVFRRANPEDNRASLIFLTDKGRNTREKLVPLALGVLDKALAGIEQDKIYELKILLNKIYQNIE